MTRRFIDRLGDILPGCRLEEIAHAAKLNKQEMTVFLQRCLHKTPTSIIADRHCICIGRQYRIVAALDKKLPLWIDAYGRSILTPAEIAAISAAKFAQTRNKKEKNGA